MNDEDRAALRGLADVIGRVSDSQLAITQVMAEVARLLPKEKQDALGEGMLRYLLTIDETRTALRKIKYSLRDRGEGNG